MIVKGEAMGGIEFPILRGSPGTHKCRSAIGRPRNPEGSLERMARRTYEIAEYGYVRPIGADATGIYRQAKTLGQVQVHASIIEFRQAETSRGVHAVHARRVYRSWRAMTLPRAARQFVKLLPIAFVPSGHLFGVTSAVTAWMPQVRIRFAAIQIPLPGSCAAKTNLGNSPPSYSYTSMRFNTIYSWPSVSNTLLGELFPLFLGKMTHTTTVLNSCGIRDANGKRRAGGLRLLHYPWQNGQVGFTVSSRGDTTHNWLE